MIDERYVNKDYLPIPLTDDLSQFIGYKVRRFNGVSCGYICSDLEQVGINYRVQIKWEKQLFTHEFVTNLIGIKPKFNFHQWRNKLINEHELIDYKKNHEQRHVKSLVISKD